MADEESSASDPAEDVLAASFDETVSCVVSVLLTAGSSHEVTSSQRPSDAGHSFETVGVLKYHSFESEVCFHCLFVSNYGLIC